MFLLRDVFGYGLKILNFVWTFIWLYIVSCYDTNIKTQYVDFGDFLIKISVNSRVT